MDRRYKLKVTPAASEDLERIYKYIKNNLKSDVAAKNLIAGISKKLKSIPDFSYMYELSRDAALSQRGYRKVVINNYIALYLVDEERKFVIISRVFYGPMNYVSHL